MLDFVGLKTDEFPPLANGGKGDVIGLSQKGIVRYFLKIISENVSIPPLKGGRGM